MRRIKREDEKGAMGVGTLIVFIAMVLVAAVAASVLIDTANKLQQQAEQTGDQAIREVSTSFTVKDAYGQDNDDDGLIEDVVLKIGLAAGAPAQNLGQTMLQLKNDTAETNVKVTSTSYSKVIEQDSDGQIDYLEQGDIVKVEVTGIGTASYFDTGNGLGTQQDLSIQIIPKHGTPTYEQITTPPTIVDQHVDLT